ncbi:efflux RND transporter periplasmic adaptor subunit [Piscirickettsia salmonis]|uniref:efflux RND transporter periplasmic adaptor subunit n=1 Tax=Piscirickettsia salmonis TaxID=1238 RepID=UPI001E37CF92|nr:efflux RND transporter periplasmic adaptor subunit [Piscirickettsia salmonis]
MINVVFENIDIGDFVRYSKLLLHSLIIVICAAVIFFIYWPSKAKEPAQSYSKVTVTVAPVKSQLSSNTISLNGLLKARNQVEIASQMAGLVKHIYFHSGQSVQQGTVLVKLDDGIYQADLSSAQAKYAAYDKRYKRLVYLKKFGDVSDQDLEAAYINLRSYQAEMDKLKVLIAQTVIKAPFSGRLGKSQIVVGSYVDAGSMLVKLVDTEQLLASYNVPGEYYPQLRTQQVVTVESDAYPNHLFQGNTQFISPIIAANTNTVLVQALIDNPEHKLTAGMYVKIQQNIGKKIKQLLIPTIALMPVIDGERVYLIDDHNRAMSVLVQVSQIHDHYATVLSGLKPGQRVVTAGQEKLKDGDKVQIIHSEASI